MIKDKALQVISHYGINNQQRKLNEEVFELQEAIRDYEEQKRVCEEFCSRLHCDMERKHIVEELGDVRFMLLQFQSWYGITDEEIEEVMEYKGNRQLGRMQEQRRK